jgi:cellulose synthase (UDP-forming)
MYRYILLVGLTVLTLHYWLWRLTSTLTLSTWLTALFSLLFFLLESILISRQLINYGLTLGARFRPKHYPTALNPPTHPSVDILIPTLDEPMFILQRAIAGCQGIHYRNKRIWILDDGDRPEIATLASQTGCFYLTRKSREGSKAGNLNHGLRHIHAEFIAVFDADFIPVPHFLDCTLPYFRDPRVGLVQTPQANYNVDPVAYNLGLSPDHPNDESAFYEFIQPIRNVWGAPVCVGTSFVVRRSALLEVGGFDASTITEDYATGLLIASAGYQVVFHNKVLSQGLAPESFPALFRQRLRWTQGTLQVFLSPQLSPLCLPGFTLIQRLCFLEGLLHWFSAWPRLFFLASPPIFTVLGIQPFQASGQDILLHFLPYYLLTLVSARYVNHRSASALMTEFYSVLVSVRVTLTLLRGLFAPTQAIFQVTPKGLSRLSLNYYWDLAWPFACLLLASVWTFWYQIYQIQTGLLTATWVWCVYNILILTALLAVLWDGPRPVPMLALLGRRDATLYSHQGSPITGELLLLSDLVGQMRVQNSGLLKPGMACQLALRRTCLLPVQITDLHRNDTPHSGIQVRFRLNCQTSPARTTLIQAIYCRPLPQRPCLQEWQVLLLLGSMPLRILGRLLKSRCSMAQPQLGAIVLSTSTDRSLKRVFVTEQHR